MSTPTIKLDEFQFRTEIDVSGEEDEADWSMRALRRLAEAAGIEGSPHASGYWGDKPAPGKAQVGVRLNGFSGHKARVTYAAYDATGKVVAWSPDLVPDEKYKSVVHWIDAQGLPITLSAPVRKSLKELAGSTRKAAPALAVAPFTHRRRIQSVAVSPDGTRIVTIADDKLVRVWSAADGSLVAEANIGSTGVVASAVSPDSKSVFAGLKAIRCFDLATGKAKKAVAGHKRDVLDLSISHSGRYLVTASADGAFALWDAASGEMLGHHKAGWQAQLVAFADDDKTIFGYFEHKQLPGRLCALTVPDLDSVAEIDSDEVCDMAVAGPWLYAALEDGAIKVLDGRLATSRTIESEWAWTRHIHFTADASRFVTSGARGARLYDTESGRTLLDFEKPWDEPVGIIRLFPNGSRAVAAFKSRLALWDAATGKPIAR